EDVGGVAVAAQGMGDVAVVAGVAHGGGQDAVYEDRAAFLVDFVLDRLGVLGNLDDDVDFVGRILAGGDVVETHALQLRESRARRPLVRSGILREHMLHCRKRRRTFGSGQGPAAADWDWTGGAGGVSRSR